MPTSYGYDKKTDYKKLMDEAARAGNYAQAAIYEAQRNEKIAGEGMNGVTATSQYANYLPGASAGTGWKNPYIDELDATIKRLGDTSATRKRWMDQARRQTEDTLGAYAANTGGIASTGAVAAAQQAGNQYRAGLAQAEQEQAQNYAGLLMSAAGMRQNEYSMQMQQAMARWEQLGYADDSVSSMLGVGLGTPTSSQSYQKWQQAMAQWEQLGYADDSVASTLGVGVGTMTSSQSYQKWQQAMERWGQLGYADEFVSSVLGVGVGTMTSSQSYQKWQQEFQQQQQDYAQQQNDRQYAYNTAMSMIQAGLMPPTEMLTAAGINQQAAKQMAGYYQQQAAMSTYRASSSGGSYSRSSSKSSGSYSGSSSSSGKALTQSALSKLLEAYDSGDLAKLENLMESYEGSGYSLAAFTALRDVAALRNRQNGGQGAQGVKMSQTANSWLTALSAQKSGKAPGQSLVNQIYSLRSSGKITEAEAEYMIGQLDLWQYLGG